MTVSSAKTGAVGLSFALDNNYMEPIATTLVGSDGVNQVTFNDIPQTYKHLQIRTNARAASATDFRIRVNSDNGSNYSRHLFYGNGSSAAVGYVINDIKGNIGTLPSATSIVSAYIIDILDYTNTNKYKTIRTFGGYDTNGSADELVNLYSSLWMNTDAITSIITFGQSANIAQYSRFSLYGIKG
jgi:hypothetical protein